MKSNYKVKAKWSSEIWISNSIGFELRHFIFDLSNAKHKKLKEYGKRYANNGYYWFEGLRGNDWFRGGSYIEPLINTNPRLGNNVQGFTDGRYVYLLKEVLTDSELFKMYNEHQLNAMLDI